MDTAPLRIECFDVSQIQGTDVVASMVVFEDGLPRKSEYRRFASVATDGAAPTTWPRCPRCCAGGSPATSTRRAPTSRPRRRLPGRRADAEVGAGRPGRAADPARPPSTRSTGRPRKFAYPPQLVVVDGGAAAGQRGRRGAGRPGHHRRGAVRAGQAAGGGLAARRRVPGDPAAHLRGALSAAAGPRRGAPVRHHVPPAAALQADDRVRRWTTSRAWARRGARRCCGTSAR